MAKKTSKKQSVESRNVSDATTPPEHNEKIADVSEVVERVSDAFVALDQDWCYTYMNKKAGQIFNRDPQSIIGKNIWEEFPEGIGQPFYHAYYNAMKEQHYVHIEEYYAPYDLWFENHIYPSPTGVTIYFRDITEKIKTSEALKKSEAHLQKILDQSLDVICTVNSQGNFISVNAATQKIWGYKPEDLIGKSFLEFVLEEDKVKTAEVALEILAGNEINNFENWYVHKNGTLIPMHWSARWDESSQLIYAISRDITKRKLAEQQSIMERNLSDSVINSLPGVFYLYDDTGKFIRWNKNLETVTGYSAEEISKMHPLDFFTGEGQIMIKQRIGEVFVKGESSAEAYFVTKKGEEIPYYFTGLAINYKGKLCLIGSGIDITARKNAQSKLEATNQQLRNLSSHLQNIREEERMRIAREIHDELGQQLTGLKMDVYWINKKLENKEKIIQEKINDIIELIDETVKSVRRISSNLRPSILDDLGLVTALQWHSKELEKRSEIKVHFTTNISDEEIPVDIATALFRIYQEALTNAVRHSNAQEVKSSLILEGRELILKTKDDGTGIDQTAKANIKTLGLIGIKERTFALGGKYELKSEQGQGTELRISVPLPGLAT